VLENYVRLEPEREVVLRFEPGSFRMVEVTMRDPETHEIKVQTRYEAEVVEEDGKPVSKRFSTLSSKLGMQLQVMHEDGELYRYKIGITRHELGYRSEYTIRVF
jgi:hypothetical protein